MEKIRLRVIFALVLCTFSSFFVFADDGDQSSSPQPAAEAENTGGKPGQQAQTPQPATEAENTGSKSGRQAQTPQPAKYTVAFDTEGGNPSPSSKTVESGGSVKLPPPPAKKGHRFEGWFTEKDGGGTEFKADTSVNKDITIYAK